MDSPGDARCRLARTAESRRRFLLTNWMIPEDSGYHPVGQWRLWSGADPSDPPHSVRWLDEAQIATHMTALLTNWMNSRSFILYSWSIRAAAGASRRDGDAYHSARTTHARSEEARHPRGHADARPGA